MPHSFLRPCVIDAGEYLLQRWLQYYHLFEVCYTSGLHCKRQVQDHDPVQSFRELCGSPLEDDETNGSIRFAR